MTQVRSVSLSVSVVDRGRYRAVVDLGVDTHPFSSVPVDVILLANGVVVDRKTVDVQACGMPLCSARCVFELGLPDGTYVLEARARDRGADKMYPDEFLDNLMPVYKWADGEVQYYFYPVVHVRAVGSTDDPDVVTTPDTFLEVMTRHALRYSWQSARVIKWETVSDVPGKPRPPYHGYLKYVEWEGTFIYSLAASSTTERIADEVVNAMKVWWKLEKGACDACIADVYVHRWERPR